MLVLLLLAACVPEEEEEEAVDPIRPDGVIEGRACDPVTHTWLEGARAYVNVVGADGVIVETRTVTSDEDGRWSLGLAAGEHTVYVTDGATTLQEQHVWLAPAGRVRVWTQGWCFDRRVLDVAVVTGPYDDLDERLEALGHVVTRVDGRDSVATVALLGDAAALSAFDVVVVEGGILEEGGWDPAAAGVRAYVDGGGRLIVVADDAQRGEPDDVDAELVDEHMGAFVGANRMEVVYGQPSWAPVNTLAEVPLLFSFSSGAGRVTYSSFAFADTTPPRCAPC